MHHEMACNKVRHGSPNLKNNQETLHFCKIGVYRAQRNKALRFSKEYEIAAPVESKMRLKSLLKKTQLKTQSFDRSYVTN